MAVISRSRARLPFTQKTLSPPSPYELLTAEILADGQRQRQAALRESGMEDVPTFKLVT
jgi:hypothetical protein